MNIQNEKYPLVPSMTKTPYMLYLRLEPNETRTQSQIFVNPKDQLISTMKAQAYCCCCYFPGLLS